MSIRREAAYYDLDRTSEATAEEWQFVARLCANEDAAYDELVRVYNPGIFHVAYRMLGDSAEAADAVQDIFLKIFKNIRGFKGEAALKTWIYRIAFSEILNRLRWWRRRFRSSTVPLSAPPGPIRPEDEPYPEFYLKDQGPSPEEALASKEREAAIQLALDRLSSDHRSIIVLRDVEGFSYGEIASILDVSVGTVKSRLARARGDLKQALARFLWVRRVT